MLAVNPEILRNVRAQLRPGRMLIAAVICGVVSLVAGISLAFVAAATPARGEWGLHLLGFAIGAQAFVLVIGGGVACVHAIQREKDMNTFDFQRVTRLAPIELALGKLFGTPAMPYFLALCLLPAALVGAAVGGARLDIVVAAYGVLLLGTICYHAFALLLSLLVERGAATIAVLLFLGVVFFPSPLIGSVLAVGDTSPFAAADLSQQTTWAPDTGVSRTNGPWTAQATDLVFGQPVHHAAVLAVLYVTFAAWFLAAVVRNIKRDPAVYELYTPGQALGLAVYANLVLVSLFRWSAWNSLGANAFVLGVNAALLFFLGLSLLRNRDRIRRLRQAGHAEPAWVTLSFPAPYIVAGMLLAGLGVAALQQVVMPRDAFWGLGLAVFRAVLLASWLARDILFLQWMSLRRGRRRLLIGLLYLVVGYACVAVLLSTLGVLNSEAGVAFAASVIPPTILSVTPAAWIDHPIPWGLALIAQIAVTAGLVRLQRRALDELTPAPS